MVEKSVKRTIAVLFILFIPFLLMGCGERPHLHIILESDTHKATDTYLDGQARDIILDGLKLGGISCQSVMKTLEIRGNMLILRPYVSEDSAIDQVDHIGEVKKKLVDMGFDEKRIMDISNEVPELTAIMDTRRDIEFLVASILGGSNPLLVTISVPKRYRGRARSEYIKTARQVLDELENFDEPRLMQSKADNTSIFAVELKENALAELVDESINDAIKILEYRVREFGLVGTIIKRVSDGQHVHAQIPMQRSQAEILSIITPPGRLTFKLVKPDPVSGTGIWGGKVETPEPSPSELPPGTEIRWEVKGGGWYVLESRAFMTGYDLRANSTVVRRSHSGATIVVIFLDSSGQRKFSDFTEQHIDKTIAILMDNMVYATPKITEKEDTSSVVISGDFTTDEANYLATLIKAGALPPSIQIVEKYIAAPE